MSQQPPGKRAGRVLMVLAWCAALFLATRFSASGKSASKTRMWR
jgi:aspartyl protease family protein